MARSILGLSETANKGGIPVPVPQNRQRWLFVLWTPVHWELDSEPTNLSSRRPPGSHCMATNLGQFQPGLQFFR